MAGTIWEEDKNSILYVRLNKYYQNDVLIWAEYPVEEISALFKKTLKYKEVCLNGLAPALKEQVKAYIRNELNRLDKKYAIILYNCIRPLTNVIPYMEKVTKEDILCYSDAELYDSYIDYFHRHYGKKGSCADFNILRRLKYFTRCLQQQQCQDIFERDIWNINEIHLSGERINRADTISDFEFFTIDNPYNKSLLKMYLKAQLSLTGNAYATIRNEYGILADFIRFLGDTDIGTHTREDISALL